MHLRLTRAAPLALALALVCAAPAVAQPDAEFPSRSIPGWSFTPSMTSGVVYDSNVALAVPEHDIGETEDDAIIAIVPAGRLAYRGKLTTFTAGYTGFLRRYVELEGLDIYSQRGSIGLTHRLSRRVSFYARDGYEDSPTTDDIELNGVPYRRTGSRLNIGGAGVSVRLTKLTSVDARYDVTWVDFTRGFEEVPLPGGWIHGVGGNVSRRMNDRLTVRAEYSYRTSTIEETIPRDFQFHDGGGGLSYQLGPHTSVSASAGLSTLEDRTQQRSRSGLYFNFNISHAEEHMRFGGSYGRNFAPTFGFGGSTSSDELRGYVQVPLPRQRLVLRASAGWRHAVPFETQELEVDTVRFDASVGYLLSWWARLEGVYSHTRQDSIITGGEVFRHRVGVQLVVSQPMRIR